MAGRPDSSRPSQAWHVSLDNGRGVMCANAVAKPLGRVLRQELQAAMCRAGGTEQPSHTARLFVARAQAAGQSAGLLIADVKSAFFPVWPELAVGAVLTASQRQDLFTAGILGA